MWVQASGVEDKWRDGISAMKFQSCAGGRSADDGLWQNACGGLRADGRVGVTVPAIGKPRCCIVTVRLASTFRSAAGVALRDSGSEMGVRGLGMAANREAQLDRVCSVFAEDRCPSLPRRLREVGAGCERVLCLCRLSGDCSTASQMGAPRRCGTGSFRSWPWVVLGGR